MAIAVVFVAQGGLPVINVTATAPKLGLPVTDVTGTGARGIAVNTAATGLAVTLVTPPP